MDIQENNKIEICDVSEDGITSNIRTVDVTNITDNEFSFIDSKVDTTKNIFISGKHTYVDDFKTIDYLALILISIKSIQELTERINILENKLFI